MSRNSCLILIVIVSISCSLNAVFERTKNFFRGLRGYDGYYYYDLGPGYYSDVYVQRPLRYRYSVTEENVPNKTSIIENTNQYVITLVLPGYQKNDVHVGALNQAIHITASGIKLEQQALTNPPITSFEQTVPLQKPIIQKEVKSQYLNGVLTITAPKLQPVNNGVEVPVQ